jgi:hypothetical protein
VPHRVVALGVLLNRLRAVGVLGILRDGLRALLDVEAGLKRRRHALGVVEVQIPRLHVLEEVGEVHRRPAEEVPVRELVRVTGSVSKFAIPGGPRPAFCVDVKPRKSSAVSGMSSAPPIPAAIAICFGRLWLPSNRPREAAADARDREEPFVSSKSAEDASAMKSTLSLRRRWRGRCPRDGAPRGRSGSGSRR